MRRRTFVFAGLAAAASAAAGCTGAKDGDTGPPVKATLLTSYGLRGRDAYAYVAKERGYFTAAGFDVSIEAGADLADNLARVAAGGAVFAPIDLNGALLAAGSGARQTGFTFVAGIHQRTTAAILVPGGGRVDGPRDLPGKTLTALPGSTVRELFPVYARLAGIDAGRVNWVEGRIRDLPGQLSRGGVAGVGDSVVGRRVIESASRRGGTVVLAYSDRLPDLYGDALATSAGYARADPARVRGFTAALLKGLADAVDDPPAAGVIMHRYAPAVTAEAASNELTLLAPYVRSAAAGAPVGALDANRVARGIAVLQGVGQLPPGLTPDQLISPILRPGV